MHITVNVPDRYVAVDGIRAPIEGAVPDDSIRTLQYDTGHVEGIVTYVDMRSEGVRDPAVIAPWVNLWGTALLSCIEAAKRDGQATDERYAEWKHQEAQRAAAEQAIIRKAHEEAEALAKAVEG